MPERIIRASEVGQYLYCSRSWWLNRVRGYAPANTADLAAGRAGHAAHGRGSLAYRAARWLGWLLLAVAAALALALWLAWRGA